MYKPSDPSPNQGVCIRLFKTVILASASMTPRKMERFTGRSNFKGNIIFFFSLIKSVIGTLKSKKPAEESAGFLKPCRGGWIPVDPRIATQLHITMSKG